MKEPNCDLVEKGRTMSIDQALRGSAPRTFSVDSVDYTNMVGGYMGDEVTAHLKKQRKHKKRSSCVCLRLIVSFLHIDFDDIRIVVLIKYDGLCRSSLNGLFLGNPS